MSRDIAKLRSLLDRIENAEGPDCRIESDAERATGFYIVGWSGSLSTAVKLFNRALPDWWLSTGLCSLSGDASCGPDYNGPARERLLREFPVERFDDGFHVDLRLGDGWHRCGYAILHVMIQALIAIEEQAAKSEAAL